jgi:hypothetical protein
MPANRWQLCKRENTNMTTAIQSGTRLRVTRRCCTMRVGDIVEVDLAFSRSTRRVGDGVFHVWDPSHWIGGSTPWVELVENASEFTPEVGAQVRLLPNPKCANPGEPTPTGEVYFPADVTRVQVVRSTGNVGNHIVRKMNGGGDHVTQVVHKSFLAPLEAAASTPEATPILDASVGVGQDLREVRALLDAANRRITQQAGQLADAQQRATQARERHEADIKLIGETMLVAAADNDMCNVFDECVEDLNRKLAVELPVRKRTFDVVFTFSQTIRVEADDEDDAVELARQDDDYLDASYLSEDDCEVEETD